LTRYLLDVNVLLSLVWEDLQSHARVKSWFLATGYKSFATCPLTQAGFVRISSSPRVLPKPASMRDAFELLAQLTQTKEHLFWPLEVPLREATAFCADKLFGPSQLTDAYLLGLAIEQNGTLVTLDGGIPQLAGPKFARHVQLLT
jgi:toxin-antitoxin system PIN domain toxin